MFKHLPEMKFGETGLPSIDEVFSGVGDVIDPIHEINSELVTGVKEFCEEFKKHFEEQKFSEVIRLTFDGIKTSIANKEMDASKIDTTALLPSVDLAGLMTGSLNVEMPDPEKIFDGSLAALPAVDLAKKLFLALKELVMRIKAKVEELLPAVPDKVAELISKCSDVDPSSIPTEAQEAFASNPFGIPSAMKNAKNNLANGLKLKELLESLINNIKLFFEELLNSMKNVKQALTAPSSVKSVVP